MWLGWSSQSLIVRVWGDLNNFPATHRDPQLWTTSHKLTSGDLRNFQPTRTSTISKNILFHFEFHFSGIVSGKQQQKACDSVIWC